MPHYGEGNVVYQDRNADRLHLFEGFSNTQQAYFSSADSIPTDVDIGPGGHMVSVGQSNDKAYVHDPGFSSTVRDSFAVGGSSNPAGIVFDGTDNLSSSANTDKLYKHTGYTATVQDSFAAHSNTNGAGWDGTDLYYTLRGGSYKRHRKLTGFSNTVQSSIAAAGGGTDPTCITMDQDNSNFYTCGTNLDKIFQHTGFTTTVTDSFSTPSANPQGLAWDARMPLNPLLNSTIVNTAGMGAGV